MQASPSPTLCSHCGARLRAGVPGEVLRCEYCGSETRVPPVPVVPFGGVQGPVVRITVPTGKVSAAPFVISGIVVAFSMTIGVAVAVFSASRSTPPRPVVVNVPDMPAMPAIPASPPKEAKRAPADYFADSSEHLGWVELAVTPPGAQADFDVLAAVPWAIGIARQWKPDAELHRIDADAFDETGRLDFVGTKEAKAEYRFSSPSALADFEKSASPSGRAEYEAELFLDVSGEGVKALRSSTSSPRKQDAVPAPKACTLKQAMDALRARKKVPDRHAYYTAYLIDLSWGGKRDQPSWYINPVNHAFSLPIVDGNTCKAR